MTVRPDGEEHTESWAQVFTSRAEFDVRIPEAAIPGAMRTELVIYPNLLAHVIESIEGILRRPYGCAEQTISSAYPSLLYLRATKQGGGDERTEARARRYLRQAYERLLSYRVPGGGFSYWGRGGADAALTAYALKFLIEADEFIELDADAIRETRDWLFSQASPEGTWPWRDYSGHLNERRTAMQTAYVLRILTAFQLTEKESAGRSGPGAQRDRILALGRSYLARQAEAIDEPYLIASFALVAFDAGDKDAAMGAVERLRALAKEERGMTYWVLETNTPFYGWGRAGRIETTAVVLQALLRAPARDALNERALLFLLRGKDRYGVWYSTQATVNVLEALLAAFAASGEMQGAGTSADIVVNGNKVKLVDLPPLNKPAAPVTVDLSSQVLPGASTVQILRSGGAPASAQVRTIYYVPWLSERVQQAATEEGAGALRLLVQFDKTTAAAGEEIRCAVEAERIGFRGYGMMLAEIGLPPGADVDRASLEAAMKASGWDFSQYDILPDRLVVYLWPHAGGTKFEFAFRPRFGIEAKTPASFLYDYYNPDARVTLVPVKFQVQSPSQ